MKIESQSQIAERDTRLAPRPKLPARHQQILTLTNFHPSLAV
ncbi:MAG: hypothetical protein U0V02_10825 [Anaerolineales bacterium]